jgi:hypothetical protein
MLLRHERHRRAVHHVGDGRELFGRGLGLCDEPGDDIRRGGQHQDAPDDLADRVQPVSEPGRDAEVAAPSADGPEQVGIRLGVHPQELAVGRDDVRGDQRVDGQSVLPDEVAHPTAEGDATDADGTGVAEPCGQAVGGGRGRVLSGGQAGLGPCRALLGIDLETLHVPQVEHDAALGHAVPGGAVPATPDGQVEAGLARQPHDP